MATGQFRTIIGVNDRYSIGKRFSIVNGPSAAVFVDAFKYAYDLDAEAKITIDIGGSSRALIRIKINTIRHEDGSGTSFLFSGYCNFPDGTNNKVDGYYNSRTRNGYIDVVR